MRLTYCSLRGHKPRIQCFVERMGKAAGLEKRVSTITKHLPERAAPITFLGIICGSRDSNVQLLAIHEDGYVRCVSQDLSVDLWEGTLSGLDESIQDVFTVTTGQADSGILRGREDVLARLNLENTSQANVEDLLIVLIKTMNQESQKTELSMRIFRTPDLGPHSAVFSGGSRQKLEYLLDLTIPEPSDLQCVASGFYVHNTSGKLYEWGKNILAIYAFGSPVPQLEKTIKFKSDITSCLRISSNLVVISSSESISIIDTKFSSVQSSTSIKRDGDQPKDKDDSVGLHSSNESVHLLSYFHAPDTVLALQGRALMSFQVRRRDSASNSGYRATQSGTLANAVGRGLNLKAQLAGSQEKCEAIRRIGFETGSETLGKEWKKQKKTFDEAAEKADPEAFDKSFSHFLKTYFANGTDHVENFSRTVSSTELASNSRKISFILSKIFAVKEVNTRNEGHLRLGLQIRLLPTRTYQWLVLNRVLTFHRVQTALRQSDLLSVTEDLHPNALVEALVSFDFSLQTVMFFLAADTPLSARELVIGVRVAIDVLQQSHNLSSMKLITDSEMLPDIPSEEQEMVQESHQMEKQGSPKPEENADTVHDAQAVMSVCLSRLIAFHDRNIQAAFRHELSASGLLALVDYLRMELAGGGCLTRYVDDAPHPAPQSTPHTSQMTTIAQLLSSAIDSLGAGAWLLGSSVADAGATAEGADKLAYMKAEVSAALEGVEEAAYLQGLLHETLLYSKIAPRERVEGRADGMAGSASVSAPVDERGMSLAKPVKIGAGEADSNALPLGLKPQDHVEIEVDTPGGGVERKSLRDIGRLKSRKVGVYSFERIVI